jgi:hypothetical protein
LRWQPGRLPYHFEASRRQSAVATTEETEKRRSATTTASGVVALQSKKHGASSGRALPTTETFRHANNVDEIRCAETGVDRGGGFARLAGLSFSPFSWRSVSAFGRDNTLERIPCTWLLGN